MEHEQKRRQQLEKLFTRTKEQIDEELYLTEELKKIEISKKERERKQQDVNKLLTAVVDFENSNKMQQLQQLLIYKEQQQIKQQQKAATDSTNKPRPKQQRKSSINGESSGSTSKPSSSHNNSLNQQQRLLHATNESLNTSQEAVGGGGGGGANPNDNLGSPSSSRDFLSLSADHRQSQCQTTMTTTRKSLIFKAVVESGGIKFGENKLSGVSLRSYKMKLPGSVGLKKTKAIEQLLDELHIEQRPIATEEICDQFNDLRSDIVLLYELQQALTNCEFELQSFRHRYEPILTAKNIDMGLFESTLPPSSDTADHPTKNSSLLGVVSGVANNPNPTTGGDNNNNNMDSLGLTSNNTPQKRISELFDVNPVTSSGGPLRRKAALNQTNILKRLRGRNP
jgi:hypothetical protein